MTLSLTLIIEGLIFAIVFALTIAVSRLLVQFTSQRRRLGEQLSTPGSLAAPLLQARSLTNPFFRWVQSSTSLNDSKERIKLRQDLSLAGFNDIAAPVWFVVIRFALAIGLPLIFLLSQRFLAKPFSGSGLIFWPLVLCGIGLIAPRSFIDRRSAARKEQLEREFPDALDLMVVCVEAGLSLDAAFIRVCDEVTASHPRIAEEFGRVSDELRAGMGTVEALRSLADRTDVSGVKSFAGLVIQTEALGGSVGQTLRTYAAEMRETRFLKAEEKAMRIPVLMTMPLVACILPVIITALLLPAIIDVIRNVLPALAHTHGG